MTDKKDRFPTSPGCPVVSTVPTLEFQQIEAHHEINLLRIEYSAMVAGDLKHYFTIIKEMNTSQLIRFTVADNSGESLLVNIVCFEVDPIGMREGWGNIIFEKLPELNPDHDNNDIATVESNVNDATGMDQHNGG